MQFKRIFFIWITLALLTGFTAGLTTIFVDPYGFFGLFLSDGFNQQKEGVRNKIRFVKTLELPLRQPRTVVIGSSRVHDAMNPEHPILKELGPAYNLGVDMNRIHETLLLLKHATENSTIKRVVIGLDFFMFNSLQRQSNDFDEKITGRKIAFTDYLVPAIFSATSIRDSIRTIQISKQEPLRREFLPNGYRPQAFFSLKDYPAAHYYTNWIFLTSHPQGTRYYHEHKIDDSSFVDFESILKLCREKNIQIRLYLSPAHANLDGEGIRALGKWEALEEWKRRITKISDQHNVPLWDFSGYNSVTTEKVSSPMQYYWDSSHFNEKVSDWILKRIFQSDEKSIPQDFGIQLTPRNIEEHLESIRHNRERYFSENRNEIEKLLEEYASIINGAPLDAARIQSMHQ